MSAYPPQHSPRDQTELPQPLISSNSADARTLAILTAIGLLTLCIIWLARGGMTNQLVEIDNAPRRAYTFSVDINTADTLELCQLPEVGETLAARIVEYRAAHGPFATHDDLRNVRGIGAKTLAKFKQYLRPIP